MNQSKRYAPLLCLLGLASCGPEHAKDVRQIAPYRAEVMIDETYRAILRPYNNSLSGWIPNGKTEIEVSQNQIKIKSWLDDSANVMHIQNIHSGTECPSIEHDRNRDGLIDFYESQASAKKILIPLDSDLSSQLGGLKDYPRGNFSYYQTAYLSDMTNDLNMPDPDASDEMIKLPLSQTLHLEGKVIIVMGVSSNTMLPSNVRRLGGYTLQESIPIACGVIEKVEEDINN